MARGLALALLLTALAALPGCGWQLRGSYDLPPELVPIAIEGGSGIDNQLRRNLARVDALGDGDAASRLEILEDNNDRRVVSIDRDGKVNEYEVRYTVRWQLTAPADSGQGQRVLIAPRTLESSRTYNYDSDSVLSKSEEERARIEAMRDDMTQQILFLLQGWQPPSDSGSGEADAAED